MAEQRGLVAVPVAVQPELLAASAVRLELLPRQAALPGAQLAVVPEPRAEARAVPLPGDGLAERAEPAARPRPVVPAPRVWS